MFTRLNSQGVRSDKGYEVESMGRFSMHYREGKRFVDVYVEYGRIDGKVAVIIEPDAFARWAGDPSETSLTKEKQKQMLENFTEGLRFLGVEVLVD